jgi:galactose mutarotase-like enzyme
MVNIENANLFAKISPLGAELQNLVHTQTGMEYMWEGNPAYWGKYSPVLFPVVGNLKENTYFFEGKAYSLPRHGFARERTFSVEQVSQSKAVFTLEADEDSLKVYPFDFRFQLIYELKENALHCTYAVSNSGPHTLWFSVGAHPAFKVPLVNGTAYEDHFLQYNVEEPLQRWHLLDGLISDKSSEVAAASGRVTLHPSLFYDDAIVLKHLQSNCITLASTAHEHGLHFHFEGFPYLGIWAAKDAPFVCIEPWCGHADTVGHNQQLTEKPGIEGLEAGGSWERTWKVEVF